jgi:hypothetical protein
MTRQSEFYQISSRFTSNIYALRTFAQEIGELAKQHDNETSKKLALEFLVL